MCGRYHQKEISGEEHSYRPPLVPSPVESGRPSLEAARRRQATGWGAAGPSGRQASRRPPGECRRTWACLGGTAGELCSTPKCCWFGLLRLWVWFIFLCVLLKQSVTSTSPNTRHFPDNPALFSLAPTESPALETSHPSCTQDHALPSSSLLSPKRPEMRQRGIGNSSPIKHTDFTKNRHTQVSPFPRPHSPVWAGDGLGSVVTCGASEASLSASLSAPDKTVAVSPATLCFPCSPVWSLPPGWLGR